MDLADRIRELASRIPTQLGHISTEEAAKNALVLPFLNALGYNVFDPLEVTPELIADVGTKRGEKVDYAILRDGKPLMLVECKGVSCDLDQAHASQLFRYFSVTDAQIGILTNGIVYRFFSDLDAPNKMDSRPFFELNLLALDDIGLSELKKFQKSTFDIGTILASATELKYTREIKRVLAQELQEPSDDLVRFFVSRVYDGRMTQAVRELFAGITQRALQQFISERVRGRLADALANETERVAPESAAPVGEEETPEPADQDDGIVTTPEEIDAFNIVRAILTELVEPTRIVMRDHKTYCGILFDNNNRKPICRLWFNTSQKYLGLFDEAKSETRVPIDNTAGIFHHSGALKATIERYLEHDS